MTFVFENDVNMYGIQTYVSSSVPVNMFENDVNMYGIQTVVSIIRTPPSLRMM